MTKNYEYEHERILDEILEAARELSEAADKSHQQVRALVTQLDQLQFQRQVGSGQREATSTTPHTAPETHPVGVVIENNTKSCT